MDVKIFKTDIQTFYRWLSSLWWSDMWTETIILWAQRWSLPQQWAPLSHCLTTLEWG